MGPRWSIGRIEEGVLGRQVIKSGLDSFINWYCVVWNRMTVLYVGNMLSSSFAGIHFFSRSNCQRTSLVSTIQCSIAELHVSQCVNAAYDKKQGGATAPLAQSAQSNLDGNVRVEHECVH